MYRIGVDLGGTNIAAGLVNENPECILGLATGSTPVATYKGLIEKYNNGEISFKEVKSVNLDEYNAQLATMATEEERAAYIQETLTGLYGEAADAYAENNAAIIEANKAQADLTDATAELGAAAEPLNTIFKGLAATLITGLLPYIKDLAGALQTLFSGDILFENGFGRTDLPGGSWATIRKSLLRLAELSGDYDVYPGHGDATTLSFERKMNPYMR